MPSFVRGKLIVIDRNGFDKEEISSRNPTLKIGSLIYYDYVIESSDDRQIFYEILSDDFGRVS